MNELWIIGVVGGGAGAALGAPLMARGRTRGAPWSVEQLAGLWLVGGAMSIVLVALRHGGLFSPRADLGVEILTDALGLIAWTVLVMLVHRIAGVADRWPRRVRDHLVVPGAYLMIVAAAGFPDVPHLWLMPIGVASTAEIARTWHAARANAAHDASRQLTALAVFAIVLCAAQLLRSGFPEALALREIVPVVVTASFFAAAFVLARPPRVSSAPVYARSGLTEAGAQALVARLDAGMNEHAWYRDAELSLASLAGRLGVTSQWLSQALNQQRRQSLMDYLAEWRLRETRALLTDRANDVYTVEGLARQAGFASRSSFYKAFREKEGGTPARLRRRESADG